MKFHPETGETDLGYRFFRCYWGQGIATETAKACIHYGFSNLNLKTIVANAMKENPASIRVMQKLGMKFWKEEACGEEPGVVYKIDKL